LKSKKIAIIVCVVLVMLSVFGGCSSKSSDNGEASPANATNKKIKVVTVKSENGLFSVTFPDANWGKNSGEETMNEESDLEACNERKNSYCMALMENKSDFSCTYDEYADVIIENLETGYGVDIGDAKVVDLGNGKMWKSSTFEASVDSINIYMKAYIVETENYYGQLLIWSAKSGQEYIDDISDDIAKTFTEANKAV